jgi:hypothetical protein
MQLQVEYMYSTGRQLYSTSFTPPTLVFPRVPKKRPALFLVTRINQPTEPLDVSATNIPELRTSEIARLKPSPKPLPSKHSRHPTIITTTATATTTQVQILQCTWLADSLCLQRPAPQSPAHDRFPPRQSVVDRHYISTIHRAGLIKQQTSSI